MGDALNMTNTGKIYQSTYNQLHKYWDIDRILIYLALHTTTVDLTLTDEVF